MTVKLLEYQGKQLFADVGVATPDGEVVADAEAAASVAGRLGEPVVVKSQVPAGKRGRAGAIRFADTADAARQAAAALLGTSVGGHVVGRVLVERAVPIVRELYAAVLNDASGKGPLVLFSTEGGMDIEEVNAGTPERVARLAVDIRAGLTEADATRLLDGADIAAGTRAQVAATLVRLYELYRRVDADLVEVNPLAVVEGGRVVALDSKVSLDPGALRRHEDVVAGLGGDQARVETDLERDAREIGLQFIDLDGEVGVLANGAGLTMTTLDAVTHYGGRPADFLEIGGDAYTKATPALRLLLRKPSVRSLLVNFCGAFARTDVMTEGVVGALEELRPEVPVFFSIHGTGEDEAIATVRERLGLEPYELMDDAVRAAVDAAVV
ncbi:MAG: acetate--CoA ligase family protein [Streptosporangiales bacterium]|nr:acetate--CoA ligase family protein [Streptosporangiales bacterium]MBO0890244.1 acetate--CoA ligase family protein [Acidothermales bacterium]